MKRPKVAIVHDWFTVMGGAERTALSLAKAFPGAPIYTSVYDPTILSPPKDHEIRATFLQKFPRFLRNKHVFFPTLRPMAFRRLDLREFDIVISSSSAEAKAVQVRPDAVHICYCHTPIRYYWSHYQEYLDRPGFGPLNPLVRLFLPLFVGWMRRLDLRSVKGVDHFIANSATVAERIEKYYSRPSTVIHPPVQMERFRKIDITKPRKGFVVVGRQVPYKRVDLAVTACTKLGLPLTVLGDGSQHEQLVAMAGPTITFNNNASDKDIEHALSQAEGFIFAAEEDFGIVQIEAMAAGCPVIAYGVGGSLDAVIDGETGIFFGDQTVESLTEALQRFQKMKFNPRNIQQHAETFSEENFIKQIQKFVKNKN